MIDLNAKTLNKLKASIKVEKLASVIAILVFILLFMVVGSYFLLSSHAANPILGDINNDGTVNIYDLSLLLASYGQNTTQCITASQYTCDLNSDGVINVFDLSILLSHYGQSSGGGGGNAPVNTVAPYFTASTGASSCTNGCAIEGQQLSVTPGTWSNSPASYTTQWMDCTTTSAQPPTTASCANATGTGANTSTYTVSASDIGKSLVPIVTATNASGSASTSINGSLCDSGATPGGDIGTQGTNIYPDPIEPAGCSPISAVSASSQVGETFCTNAPVTCGYPDPLGGTAGVPPGTSLTTVSSLSCTSGTVSGVYVTGSISLSGTCTLENSRIVVPNGGLNLQNYSDLTLINDDFAGAYSGESSVTTGTGEAANISAQCTYSYSGGTSNSYDLVFDGPLADAHLSGDYFHCAVEPLNGHAGATGSYLISDEAVSGTHNEAIYSPGGDGYTFENNVILNPWSQTAGLFTDCKLHGPPNGATVIDNLAATYGSNGALGVQDGSNSSCDTPTPSNITVENNRYSYIYNATMSCGYASGVGVTFIGNIEDDSLSSLTSC